MTSFRFLSSVLFLAVVLFQPLQVSATEEGSKSIYVVTRQKFTGSHPNYAPGSFLIDKCVFYQVNRSGRMERMSKDMAQRTADDLQGLKDYVVLDKHGNSLDIRYSSFEMAIDDFPNYYAAAEVPKAGCGNMLVPRSQRPTAPKRADMERFVRILRDKEKELFLAALRQPPNWMPPKQQDDVRKHDLSVSFEKSKKSDLFTFFDGEHWYFVRSYFVSMHAAPTQLSILLLYRAEFQHVTLIPMIGYLGTQGGEGTLYLEPIGSFDVDGDRRIELLVLQHGSEWRGASYLRYQDDRWQ